jgi:hypothetical protein
MIISVGLIAPLGVFGVRFALGLEVTLGQSVALVLAGCVPAIVMLAVFRGAPPRTIGQVLYDTDQASPEMQPIPIGPAPRALNPPTSRHDVK